MEGNERKQKQDDVNEADETDAAAADDDDDEEEHQQQPARLVRKRTAAEKAAYNEQRWEEMFKRLKAFKQRHGHCKVPNRYKDDPQLGHWVSTQRRQYQVLTSGGNQSVPLSLERARMLADIGFEWNAKDPTIKSWEERFSELCAFKEKYGHTLVPMGWEENPKLATWVSGQRQEYKHLLNGHSSRINWAKVEKLKEVGFVFQATRGRRRISDSNNNISNSPSSEAEGRTLSTAQDPPPSAASNQQSVGVSPAPRIDENLGEQAASSEISNRLDDDGISRIRELLVQESANFRAPSSFNNNAEQNLYQLQSLSRQEGWPGVHAPSATPTAHQSLASLQTQLMSEAPQGTASSVDPFLLLAAANRAQHRSSGAGLASATAAAAAAAAANSWLSPPSSSGLDMQQLFAIAALQGREQSRNERSSATSADELIAQLQARNIRTSNLDLTLSSSGPSFADGRSSASHNLSASQMNQTDLLRLLGANVPAIGASAALARPQQHQVPGANSFSSMSSQNILAEATRIELRSRLAVNQILQQLQTQQDPSQGSSLRAPLPPSVCQQNTGWNPLAQGYSAQTGAPMGSFQGTAPSLESMRQAQQQRYAISQGQRPNSEASKVDDDDDRDRKPPAKKPRSQG